MGTGQLVSDAMFVRTESESSKGEGGNPQIPGDLLDRNAPYQMIPADPRNRPHNQHLPLTSSVQ